MMTGLRETPLGTKDCHGRIRSIELLLLNSLELRCCAPRGIRTPNRQIRSLVLCVDLAGSRRI